MKKKILVVALYIFNLIVGNIILFVTEGKTLTLSNVTIFETLLFHISFSLSSILLLFFLVGQFRKRASYFLLFVINFCVAFLIPLIGMFFCDGAISIINCDFHFIGDDFLLYIVVGIVSMPYWSAMGFVNFGILIWYKRQFGLETSR